MFNLLELVRDHCPGALGRRIGSHPIGVLRFDLAQFHQQPVILDIADDGVIQDMVTVVVAVDFLLKLSIAGQSIHTPIILINPPAH